MAVGQQVLGADVLDVAELDRVAARLEARELERSVRHAEQLVDVLALHRTYGRAGMGLATAAYLALLLSCSEHRAALLLSDAQVLERLGALPDMRAGLLTIEQARAVVDLLGTLDDDLASSLWQRFRDRLARDLREGVVRPPARMRELLKGWVIAADPEGYAARRRAAAVEDADVELWKREDGLADLAGRGLSAAEAQACLDRIEQLAQPTGPDDERSAGQRRRDVYRDLLLGRPVLPFDHDVSAGCCPPGSAGPCGAQVFVHVPLDTACGHRGEPAELVGYGPIDDDAVRELLSAAPVLHRVWTDEQGVPVAVEQRTWFPGRDPALLQQALIEIAAGSPPDLRHPVHPDDHASREGSDPPQAGMRVVTRPHVADPGPYVPPRRLKQLLRVRAPRCEWPGCGRRASLAVAAGCDLDHDLAWPYGPTCSCNLGPLCRRHHRIKQLGWIKQRRGDGSVRWTGPTGRGWRSPSQHARSAPDHARSRPASGS